MDRASYQVRVWGRGLSAALLGARRDQKALLVGVVDSISCFLAVLLSFSVRLGYWQIFTPPVMIFFLVAEVIFLIIFLYFGVYDSIFRFHGSRGLAKLARCCAMLGVALVMCFGIVTVAGIPRTVSLIFPLVFFAFIALQRVLARWALLELADSGGIRRRVLIYGAGSAGRQLASSLSHGGDFDLVGFVDDDQSLSARLLEDVPVFHGDQIENQIERLGVDIVFLAMPGLRRRKRSATVRRLHGSGVQVQTLPGVREITDGKVSISDLRQIEVTDLLSRDTVRPDPALMANTIVGRTVLVTGAGGSIGSELCRQIARYRPRRLILAEMTEAALFSIEREMRGLVAESGSDFEIIAELGSLVEQATCDRLFERWAPETVFHAAAYKHVPIVEVNAIAGVRNNVLSTLNCAHAAKANGAERFILISTDKAVRPTNVMGASKRLCELVLQALSEEPGRTVFTMVRFGNVLGSSGSVVPHFQHQIAQGGPVTLTHRDVTRFFMTIPEAAELVIQAGAMAKGGEVYLLDMGEPVSIYSLAQTMIRLSGRTVKDAAHPDGDIEIVEVGLRPGEKLYEELLIDGEAEKTDHERIFRAREVGIAWSDLHPELEFMREALDNGDSPGIRALLVRLVSGYGEASSSVGGAQKIAV